MGQLHDAGNTTTLSHYLSLLDNVGLLSGLEKFSKGVIVQRSSSPKFQVQNTALLSALSNYVFSDALANFEIWGRHVESAIGAHLINAAKTGDVRLMYWRDGNFEVDYILECKGKIIGLEVKTGNSKFTSGMNRFKSQFNPHKMYLVAENGLNWKEFIKINPVDLF